MDTALVLSTVTLFAVILALIILVILLYLVMSLRGRLGKLLDHENQGNKETRKQRPLSALLFGSKSNPSTGCCNKPDPLEVVTRVPSPMSVRKRLQRLSGRIRPRQSSRSSSTVKTREVSHQPVLSSPNDEAILPSTAPNEDGTRAQNVEPRFQPDNFTGSQQEVLSKSTSWPRFGEDVNPRLPPKHNQPAERQAASFGARDSSVMIPHSSNEMPKRFFHAVSSGYNSGSTMEADDEMGIELHEKPPGYVNKDEIRLNELLRKHSGDKRTVNDQRL